MAPLPYVRRQGGERTSEAIRGEDLVAVSLIMDTALSRTNRIKQKLREKLSGRNNLPFGPSLGMPRPTFSERSEVTQIGDSKTRCFPETNASTASVTTQLAAEGWENADGIIDDFLVLLPSAKTQSSATRSFATHLPSS